MFQIKQKLVRSVVKCVRARTLACVCNSVYFCMCVCSCVCTALARTCVCVMMMMMIHFIAVIFTNSEGTLRAIPYCITMQKKKKIPLKSHLGICFFKIRIEEYLAHSFHRHTKVCVF